MHALFFLVSTFCFALLPNMKEMRSFHHMPYTFLVVPAELRRLSYLVAHPTLIMKVCTLSMHERAMKN